VRPKGVIIKEDTVHHQLAEATQDSDDINVPLIIEMSYLRQVLLPC
jgi:hypothetical protein